MDSQITSMDIEAGRLLGRRDVSFVYLICQGSELLVKLKNRALAVAVFFFTLEAISFFLDIFGKSQLNIRILAFIVSAFGFGMTMVPRMSERNSMENRVQDVEKQLGVLEIGFSVVQLIATFFAVLGIKVMNNHTTSILLVLFAATAVIYTFKREAQGSDTSHLENNSSSSIAHLQIASSPNENDEHLPIASTTNENGEHLPIASTPDEIDEHLPTASLQMQHMEDLTSKKGMENKLTIPKRRKNDRDKDSCKVPQENINETAAASASNTKKDQILEARYEWTKIRRPFTRNKPVTRGSNKRALFAKMGSLGRSIKRALFCQMRMAHSEGCTPARRASYDEALKTHSEGCTPASRASYDED